MDITLEKVEQLVRQRANPDFRYERNETAPFVRFEKKVSESRGALITTGGVFVKGQQPFCDHFGIGDPSYREIPSDTPVKQLSHYHEHYDPTNITKDMNCVFPIERMHRLKETGSIGSLAETFYSFMGYLTVPHPLKTITAPQVTKKLLKDNVDFAVLVPV